MVKEATQEKKQEKPLVVEGKITGFRPFEPGVYLEMQKQPEEGQVEMHFSGKGVCREEIEVRAELRITEHTTGNEEGGDKVEKARYISIYGDAPIKWEAWGGWKLSDNKVSIIRAANAEQLHSEVDFLSFSGEDVFSYKDKWGDVYAVRMKFKGHVNCRYAHGPMNLILEELILYALGPGRTITPDTMKKVHERIAGAAEEVVAFSAKVEGLLNSKEGLEKVRRLELPPKRE